MPVNIKAELLAKEQLKPDIFKFTVSAKEISDTAKPGQFLEIRVSDTIDPFLRRPISIYEIDTDNNTVSFIFQVKGKGTEILAKKEVGDLVDILGPLGKGTFKIDNYDRVAIIGGGIGVFPLYELSRNAIKSCKNVDIYLGFRNKDFVVLENEFKNVSTNLKITTDDGSYGINGYAINVLKDDLKNSKVDMIYACGPLPMLRAVQALAIETNTPCQISLEEKMGCGIGACLGCAVKVANKEPLTYKHVCKAGPVFDATTVEI